MNTYRSIGTFLIIIMVASAKLFSFCHSCADDKYDIHFITQPCEMEDCTRNEGASHCEEENCNHQLCTDQILNENCLTPAKQIKSGLPILTSSVSLGILQQFAVYINTISSDFYLSATNPQRNPVLRI